MNRADHRGNMLAHGFALGIAGGLRSLVPLAMVSRAVRSEPRRFDRHAGWTWLRSDRVGTLLDVALVGELFGDKLPGTPDRIRRGPLVGRMAVGAIAGAAFGRAVGQGRAGTARTALAGSAGALVGAFAGYYARRGAAEALGQPDAVIALIEDVTALAIGSVAARP